jgi:hypothetical protein
LLKDLCRTSRGLTVYSPGTATGRRSIYLAVPGGFPVLCTWAAIPSRMAFRAAIVLAIAVAVALAAVAALCTLLLPDKVSRLMPGE